MAQEFSQMIYRDPRWKRIRESVVMRDHGLCQDCLKRGEIRAGSIVHHIIWLTPENVNDPAIAFNADNCVYVCRECHARIHGVKPGKQKLLAPGLQFDANGRLVHTAQAHFIIVTGAPCSGKSTYILQNAKPDEPIFAVSGIAEGGKGWGIVRDRRAFIEEQQAQPVTAWIEAGRLSDVLKRDLRWCDYEHRPMRTTEGECLERLRLSDRTRKDEWATLIAKYF